jgi:molecular chaperone GrpE
MTDPQDDNQTEPQDDPTPQTDDSATGEDSNPTEPTTELSPLEQAKKETAEMREMALRAVADLQNFKRRTDEQRSELALFANINFLQAIFPVIDNFKRAFNHIPEDIVENEWVKAISGIEKSFVDTLQSLGLKEVPCLVGAPFDPNLHEVVMQDAGTKDAILECFEKGYTFKEKVVRPAKVKVGNGN